jgi:two-component system nitrate/nitrite response regulator NarL
MSEMGTTVIVADDHPLMLEAVCNLIKDIPSLTIVHKANNGAEALMFIGQEKPDIAILDIDMPLMNGLDVVRSAKQAKIDTRFIVLTFHKEAYMLKKALELGVMGYLLKEDSSVEIIECIEHVRHGRSYISKAIEYTAPALPENLLTDTEAKIIKLIGQGMSSQKISELLFVSIKTIENHRSNICRKLNLDGTHNSLVKWALEHKHEL